MKRIFLPLFICFCFVVIAQEPYKLSSESVLTISGTSTVHDWEVTANSVSGSLMFDGEEIKELKIEVIISEIKSERGPAMDKKMRATLKAEEHPIIVFTLKELNSDAALVGELVIAGIEKEVNVKGAIANNNDAIAISGSKKILFADYEMEPPTAMFGQIVVGEAVTVKFYLIFSKE